MTTRLKYSRFQEHVKKARGDAFRDAVRRAEETLELADQLCPEDTGDLRSTGRVEEDERRGEARVVYGGPAASGREVGYAPFVENEQPFLEPASILTARRRRHR